MRLPHAQRGPALQADFFAKIGNVIFVLLPVFAVILRLLCCSSRPPSRRSQRSWRSPDASA
jgi:hypothetical protein